MVNKSKEIIDEAIEDAENLLTMREKEEYNALNEEQNHSWMQALDDDAEAVKHFLELVR